MNTQERDALWALESLENGTATTTALSNKMETLDPVLIHFVFVFLRSKYGSGNPAGEGVMKRTLDLSANHSNLISLARHGEKDPITEWFNDTYSVKDYFRNPEELFAMLAEKIES